MPAPTTTAASDAEQANVWIAASDGDADRVMVRDSTGVGDAGRLLDAGTPVDAQDAFGYTPLAAAASYRHTDLVRALLARGANPNVADADGDTPLHVVETAEIAGLLVAAGADPARRNADGVLPIETADEEERDEVVEFLKAYTPEYRVAARHTEEAGAAEEGLDLSHVLREDGEGVTVNLEQLARLLAAAGAAGGDGGVDELEGNGDEDGGPSLS
ncbi:hypothetical protein HK405_013474 [Cladochytrium tenue]|nr:hypothetical protein HK405_013474 [Cladochytrium tenue]